MAKILALAPEKCSSCRTCELACSFQHNQEFRPTASRVAVFSWETVGVSVPMMCLQCDNAACVKVCPVGAITKSDKGAMVVNENRCIKCKMCLIACPFGNTTFDGVSQKIIKCDLCQGDPACVKFCPNGAITYKEPTAATMKKKKAYAAKFKELVQEVSE